MISLLISGGIAWWTTEQTKRDNERTIASASELARSEHEYRQRQMDRHFADKAGIVVRKYKSQGFVRIQVANTGSKPFRDLRMETDEGGGRLTYIRLALVHPCENARFAIPFWLVAQAALSSLSR